MKIRQDSKVAVVGAGTMGAGIAMVAASAGHDVVVVDTRREGLEAARRAVCANLSGQVAKGRINQEDMDTVLGRINWTTNASEVEGASLAIEAVVEILEVKRNLFAELAAILGEDALLASNTSSLPITQIAEGLPNPGRVLGLHFFNPVPAMKLVEVIGGKCTDPQVLAAAETLMTAWGKKPVIAKDLPGFIVNRVARCYYAEGFAALSEGIAPATIDAALTRTGGFRMGPLALGDLIGHDINYAVAVSVFEACGGRMRFRPQPAQQALVESGLFGRKVGKGVYDHSSPLPEPAEIVPAEEMGELAVSDVPGSLLSLVKQLRDMGVHVETDPALAAGTMRAGTTTFALSDGRRLADRDDIDALLDVPRDFASAHAWIVTASAAAHASVIAALARRLDAGLLLIPDRPGMIVLRTLAQLANEAADAVLDGLASDTGIDSAMRYGANHPEGPLAWARRFGMSELKAALRNIAAGTGDHIYAPSPGLDLT